MYIRLTVMFLPHESAPAEQFIVFDHSGGTIGRSNDCDWTLPDSVISRRHAQIFFADGSFYIRDQSTNGVYLNGGGAPVGRDHSAILRDSDRIDIGGFTLRIAISDTPFADARSGTQVGQAVAEEQTLIAVPAQSEPGEVPSSGSG